MVFSDASGKLGIVEDIDWLVGSDSNTYPLTHKTRNINAWLDRVVSWILQADANWEWEDTNQTDLPIGTCTLTSGQQDYSIDQTYLKIRAVAMKDSQGNYYYLDPINENAVPGGVRELMDPNKTSGTPTGYAKLGNSIVLDKKPDYTATKGLKVYFQRNKVAFTAADTAATPGFAPMFHRILSYGPALDYAVKHQLNPDIKRDLKENIQALQQGILDFYANRERDAKTTLTLAQEDYGASELAS